MIKAAAAAGTELPEPGVIEAEKEVVAPEEGEEEQKVGLPEEIEKAKKARAKLEKERRKEEELESLLGEVVFDPSEEWEEEEDEPEFFEAEEAT